MSEKFVERFINNLVVSFDECYDYETQTVLLAVFLEKFKLKYNQDIYGILIPSIKYNFSYVNETSTEDNNEIRTNDLSNDIREIKVYFYFKRWYANAKSFVELINNIVNNYCNKINCVVESDIPVDINCYELDYIKKKHNFKKIDRKKVVCITFKLYRK